MLSVHDFGGLGRRLDQREGGVAVLGAGGVTREGGTAGFDVGLAAGKVTVWQSTAPILVNQLGEAVDYLVTAKLIG